MLVTNAYSLFQVACGHFQYASEMLAKSVLQKFSAQGTYPKKHPFAFLCELVAKHDPSFPLPTLDEKSASDLILTCAGDVRYGAQLPCEDFASACNDLEPLIDELILRLKK
jgi:hypothetical protein